jgi:hypothetical protein
MQATLEKPMLPPSHQETSVGITGSITHHTVNPFSFMMTRGQLPEAKENK